MKISKQILFLLCVIHGGISFAGDSQLAMDVAKRRVPAIVPFLVFKSIPDSAGLDVFEVEASGGKVTIKGSSIIAQCRGLYDYLKNDCGCIITWEGDQLNLPTPLPTVKKRRRVASVLYRQYLNVCTFGYTTIFWDWKRWEKEIDWMAFHGINMPLALSGQEKIWQQLWKKYGCNDKDLDDFFTPPAFLPWNRMGNIYGTEGVLNMLHQSLSQNWIDKDADLQNKILNREHALGMTPVIPGFSGFIPRAIKKLYPQATTWEPTQWNSVSPSTLALHPLDPMFERITKDYVELYKKNYGDVSNKYLIDLFNEIDPPKGTTQNDLSRISSGVFNALQKADHDAIWVTMGWCFFYQSYWKSIANTAAYLNPVPDDKMIILDFNADDLETFRMHAAIARKQFIWCTLGNNWGQHTALSGNLDTLAVKPFAALKDATINHMAGMGLTAEGIEQNPVLFEFMCDNMWRTNAPNLQKWIGQWANNRYNSSLPFSKDVWMKIYESFYKKASDPIAAYQKDPDQNNIYKHTPDSNLKTLLLKMLSAPVGIKKNIFFQRDVVDVAKRYIGDNIANSIFKIYTAIKNNDTRLPHYREEFNSLMTGLDELLATQKIYRLDHWIDDARAFVPEPEKDFLERNARVQVTTWVAPDWQGYARKEWSGIVGEYYRGRWNLFFDEVAKKDFNQKEFRNILYLWSDKWCSNTILKKPKLVEVVEHCMKMMSLMEELQKN